MKTKLFASVTIFLSAYSPLALILALKDYDKEKNVFNNPIIIYTVLSIAVLSIVFLFLIMRSFTYGQEIKVKKVNSISGELVNYTIPYMISFFGFDMSKTVDLISFVIFMFLLCVLTIKTQSIFMNPILAFIGYGHYKLEYEENGVPKEAVFISSIKLKNGSNYRIDRLSDYTFIIINEVN